MLEFALSFIEARAIESSMTGINTLVAEESSASSASLRLNSLCEKEQNKKYNEVSMKERKKSPKVKGRGNTSSR